MLMNARTSKTKQSWIFPYPALGFALLNLTCTCNMFLCPLWNFGGEPDHKSTISEGRNESESRMSAILLPDESLQSNMLQGQTGQVGDSSGHQSKPGSPCDYGLGLGLSFYVWNSPNRKDAAHAS